MIIRNAKVISIWHDINIILKLFILRENKKWVIAFEYHNTLAAAKSGNDINVGEPWLNLST